jgi:PRTRC genetic system ThiF family protein
MKKDFSKESAHYIHPYIQNPQHPVTIDVIGAGGTGSMVLTHLARINAAMLSLGHRGIYVRCFDGDVVTEGNMARQLYSPADQGMYKASVLVSRINNFFGYNWKAIPEFWPNKDVKEPFGANIFMTCVDSVAERLKIHNQLKGMDQFPDQHLPLYQIDFGNDHSHGQVFLSTLSQIDQPKDSKFEGRSTLPGFIERYKITEKKLRQYDYGQNLIKGYPNFHTGSCSVAEALLTQDLFINSFVANYGCNLLWKMFRETVLQYHGVYVNLAPVQTAEIPIK